MPNRKCSEIANDILLEELKRMTKEAREYLDSKKAEFLKLGKKTLLVTENKTA